jgi:hypothetical protein
MLITKGWNKAYVVKHVAAFSEAVKSLLKQRHFFLCT